MEILMKMESQRLLFEHYSETDFDRYFQLVSNADVMKMILGRPLPEEEARERFKNMLVVNQLNPKIGHYKVSDKFTDRSIGHAKLEMVEFHQAELGYLMLPEYWQKGYGNEIAKALVNLSRKITEIHCLIAIIDPENVASKRILEKQGFQMDYEGEYYGLPAVYYELSLLTKD